MIAESINNDFFSGIDRVRRTRIPNLSLNTDDNDLFRTIIRTEQSPDHTHTTKESHQRLLDAYFRAKDHVRDTVADLNQRDHGDHLNRWLSFIEHRALVVLLRVPDDSNAYKMFETLHDRGLHTTQADLIKNYLFGRAGDRFRRFRTAGAICEARWLALKKTILQLTSCVMRLLQCADTLVKPMSMMSFKISLKVIKAQSALAPHSNCSPMNMLPSSILRMKNGMSILSHLDASIQVFNLLNIRPMRALLLAIAAKYAPIEVAKAFQFLVSLGVRLLVSSLHEEQLCGVTLGCCR